MANPYQDLYDDANAKVENIDFSDLYDDSLRTFGTGSNIRDRFLGEMLAFSDLNDVEDPLPVSTKIDLATKHIKSLPKATLARYIEGYVPNALNEILSGHIETIAELYANTGDSIHIGEAEKEIAAVEEIKKLPMTSRLVTMALAKLSQEGLRNVDRNLIVRQVNLQQLAEFVEYMDFGLPEIGGAMIPFRNTYQFLKKGGLNSYTEFKDQIDKFRTSLPEEQVQEFPNILIDLWEMSGQNPFLFEDRVLPFIDINELGKVRDWFMFDAFDAATVLPFTKIFQLIKASRTPIKFARDIGRADVAAKMTDEVLLDTTGEIEKIVGTTKVDAATSARPFTAEGAIPEATNGLAEETQKVIVDSLMKAGQFTDRLLYDGNLLINRSPMTVEEIGQRQTKYMEQFAGTATIVKSDPTGFTVDVTTRRIRPKTAEITTLKTQIKESEKTIKDLNTQITDAGTTGATSDEINALTDNLIQERLTLKALKAQLKDIKKRPKNIGILEDVTETRQVQYLDDDVGRFQAIEYSKANPYLNSSNVIINQMQRELVDESRVIGLSQQKLRGYLENIITNLPNISPSGRNRVSEILLQGDVDKIARYSNVDLVEGIKTRNGLFKLETVKELATYHTMRHVFDTMYILKNKQLYRELEFGGYKAFVLNMEEGAVISFAKPNAALKRLPDSVKRLYDSNTGSVIDVLTPSNINKRIESGWLLMRLKYGEEFGDEIIEYVLTRPEEIKALPWNVLAYRPGYVPKITKNAFFIAERVGPKTVNGVVRALYRAPVRFFDNNFDAKRWAQAQTAKNGLVEVRPSREFLDYHPDYKEDYESVIFGGLMSGKRSEMRIPFGLEGTEAERIGAFEALEAGIGHISTRLPINEFRIGNIRRFLNSTIDPITKESWLYNPGDWRSTIVLPKTDSKYAGLRAMQIWMEDQLRIPTSAERAWENFAARLANSIDGENTRKFIPGLKYASLGLLKIGQKDIYSSMRGMAFHSLLGWFNPTQLLVQAMGFTVAFAIAPHKIFSILPRSLALRAALFSDNPAVWRRTAFAAGLLPDEFEELVRAYRKTGLKEAVRSTADYTASTHGYGVSFRAIKAAADKGLIAFREGELFMRNYGWLQAYDEFIKRRPKNYKLSDADIDAVTKRSTTLTMNLDRSNRAYWQKGAFSVPTQFWQITAKFIENMAYSLKSGRGKWTLGEKARIMAMQVGLFGAAGVPFSNWAINNLLQWLKSEDDYGLAIKDPKTLELITGGFVDMLAYDWTGEQLQIASRVSIPNGVEQFFEQIMRSDRSVGDILAGAFGETGNRILQSVSDLGIISSGYDSPLDGISPQTMKEVASEVAEITSGWRNYQKAELWEKMKAVTDSKGRRIIPLDPEDDYMLLMAQKWGIQPKVIESYYDLKKFNEKSKKELVDVVDAWESISRRYVNDPEAFTQRGRRKVQNMIRVILLPLTEEQKADVAEMFMERMKEKDYALTKELLEAIENIRKSHGDTTKGIFQGNLELNSILVPDKPVNSEEQKDAQ